MEVELPRFLKAYLPMKDLYNFQKNISNFIKDYDVNNISSISENSEYRDIEMELIPRSLMKYLKLWLIGLADPYTGKKTYLGIINLMQNSKQNEFAYINNHKIMILNLSSKNSATFRVYR